MIVTDVSRLPERHKRELLRGERVRAELDVLAQRKLKEACDRIDFCFVDGLGQRQLVIAPGMAARIRQKYGMTCLHDPEFRRALLRDNPMFRIACRPAKTAIRVDGFRKQSPQIRKGQGNGAEGDPPTACSQRQVFAHETTALPNLRKHNESRGTKAPPTLEVPCAR